MIVKEALEYWPLLGFGVAFIVGYTELKIKAKSNGDDIKSLADRIQDQRKEDNQRHEVMLREIRGDIKTLLHRGD